MAYIFFKTIYKNLYWCRELNEFFLIYDSGHGDMFQEKVVIKRKDAVSFTVPLNLVWRITNICNLSCNHCFSMKHELKNADQIRKQTLERILSLAPPKLNFTGGEPLLTPNFIAILKQLKEKNIILTLTSNGLIMEKFIDEVSQYIDWFILSIDHYRPEIHDALRKKEGLFNLCMRALSRMINEKKMVRVNSVISKKNINDMEKMAAFFKTSGVRCYELIQFLPKNNAMDVKEEFAVDEQLFLSLSNEIKSKYETESFKIKINSNSIFKEYMIIEDDGFLYTVNSLGEYCKEDYIVEKNYNYVLPVLEVQEC
jgi:MoaA/NifB/PqqE/SkfB family radical SAM enzyme